MRLQLPNVESRVSNSKPHDDATAYITTHNGKPSYPPNNPAHRDETCSHYGHKGHIMSVCRKLKREQSSAGHGRGRGNGGRGNGNQPPAPMAFMACTGKPSNFDKLEWVIDSGASAHMSPHNMLLDS